jgi:hypothetical protein
MENEEYTQLEHDISSSFTSIEQGFILLRNSITTQNQEQSLKVVDLLHKQVELLKKNINKIDELNLN